MGVGHVALEGRPVHLVDRQRGEEQRVAAQRLAVGGEHGPAVSLHRPGELGHLFRRLRQPEVPGLERGGLELHALALAGASGLGGGAFPRRGHGMPV